MSYHPQTVHIQNLIDVGAGHLQRSEKQGGQDRIPGSTVFYCEFITQSVYSTTCCPTFHPQTPITKVAMEP